MSVVRERAQRSPGRGPIGLVLAVLAVAIVVMAGCSSDDGSAAGPTTEAPTTTAPVDYRSAMVARLTDEWGDADVAEQVVTAIGADGLAAWEQRVPMADMATTPLLAYRTPTTPADDIDNLVVFAFGNRVAADGTLEPGPVNQQLADATAAFVADHPVPVFAQWEVARLLVAAGVPDVTSIEPTTGPAGEVVYLSTRGVADAIVAEATASSQDLGTAGVVCSPITRAGVSSPPMPRASTAPRSMASSSRASTTRSRASRGPVGRVSYLVTDLGGRLLL